MLIRRIAATAAAACLLFTGAACGSSDKAATDATASAASGTATPAAWSHVDAATFASAIKANGIVVLDVRTPTEFADGHIEGARNVDVNDPAFTTQLTGLDTKGRYAVYCRTGHRSGTALGLMQQAGFSDAFDLAGGITAWTEAGYTTVR